MSNGKDESVENFLRENGIDYIGFAHKPLRTSFYRACDRLLVNPRNMLVIGDSLYDDIYGGNRLGMRTVLVKNVEDDER